MTQGTSFFPGRSPPPLELGLSRALDYGGKSELSVELNQGHWWSLASPYIVCRGIMYFTRKHGSEVECEQERFQLGEAPLVIQEQQSYPPARLLCTSVGVFLRTLESV